MTVVAPQHMHTVMLRDLLLYTKIPYTINLTGLLLDAQVPTTAKATAPAFNLVLADEDQSVRVALWQNDAVDIDPTPHIGTAIVFTSLRVSQGKDSSTDLGTSRRTQLLEAPQAMADQLNGRT